MLITVGDLGVLVQGVLERLAPAAATRIGAERASTLFTLHPGGAVIDVVQAARRVYSASWVLAVLAAIAAGGRVAPLRGPAPHRVATGDRSAGGWRWR